MVIVFKTRNLARQFSAKRAAKGLPSKVIDNKAVDPLRVVDNGKESAKRYAVNLRPGV